MLKRDFLITCLVRCLLFFGVAVFTVPSYSQFNIITEIQDSTNVVSFKVVGCVMYQSDAIKDADVKIYVGNIIVDSVSTGLNGKFKTRMEINQNYTILIRKYGLITERIAFNTTVPSDIYEIPKMEFICKMFSERKFRDKDGKGILDFPTGIVSWNNTYGRFLYDKTYAKNIKQDIKKLLSGSKDSDSEDGFPEDEQNKE